MSIRTVFLSREGIKKCPVCGKVEYYRRNSNPYDLEFCIACECTKYASIATYIGCLDKREFRYRIERARQRVEKAWEKRYERIITEATESLKQRSNILSWMSKFCRHIDMGDKPYTDAEAYEFFKNKMNQQFGWEVDE